MTENEYRNAGIPIKKLGLSMIGIGISTCSPEYYKHQQKILELYDKGLVYRKESYVTGILLTKQLGNK